LDAVQLTDHGRHGCAEYGLAERCEKHREHQPDEQQDQSALGLVGSCLGGSWCLGGGHWMRAATSRRVESEASMARSSAASVEEDWGDEVALRIAIRMLLIASMTSIWAAAAWSARRSEERRVGTEGSARR